MNEDMMLVALLASEMLTQDDMEMMDHMASDLTEEEITSHADQMEEQAFKRMVAWIETSTGLGIEPHGKNGSKMRQVHAALMARAEREAWI